VPAAPVAEALRVGGYEMMLARSGEEALELPGVQPVDFKELVDAVTGPGL